MGGAACADFGEQKQQLLRLEEWGKTAADLGYRICASVTGIESCYGADELSDAAR
ncbi:hypothetical protein D3C72_2434940 [compost metagenome]